MSILHFQSTIAVGGLEGIAYEMVAGLAQTQNTGYDTGAQSDDAIGTLTPAFFQGFEIQKCRRNNAGFDIVIHQSFSGEVGGVNAWSSILFSGPGFWNGFEVFSADANFADNSNFANWTGMPDAGAFINGLTYQLEWFL